MMSKAPTLLVILMVIAAGLCSPAASDILVVKADGSGEYATIQAAVDAADDGDEVHLVTGTYEGDGNRNVDFQGKAITIRSQSGDPASVIISPYVDAFTTSRAFVMMSGESQDSILQDITIFGAWSDEFSSPSGIVRCVGASPIIRGCVFANNQGSALVNEGGSPFVQNCAFRNNQSLFQVGMGISSFGGSITIVDCEFHDNHGEESGGGAFVATGPFKGVRSQKMVWDLREGH